MRVSSLHIHPVKSLRAVDVTNAVVEPKGLAGDRRWMVVGPDGRFITQRDHPVLATICARLADDGLILSAPDAGEILATPPDGANRRNVVVWSSEIDAPVAGDAVAAWLTEVVGTPANLAYMDPDADRMKDSIWTEQPVPVSFADAFPILVTTTGSLTGLNEDIEKHGGAPVPMSRFRPNLVVDCDEPWAEDHWRSLRIGSVEIDLVKPSDRCIVTTIDQASGKSMGKEPIAALARTHKSTDPRINGVIFGMNAVPRSTGEISVGDEVIVST